MFDFTDRVVMVTGGTGTLGKATAFAFAEAGARVVVVDRNREKQLSIYSSWQEAGHHVLASPYEVTSSQGSTEAVADILQQTGVIDVLVNTIGGYESGGLTHETSPDTWSRMLTLNAQSVYMVCHAVLPGMLAQGNGKIISVAARAGVKGLSKQSAYSASKSAVISLTETMAAEYRRKGINVNCVLPSTIDTPDNREAMPDADASRWVKPESIADVIQFLASELARDVHGAALPVYGRA